MFLLTICVHIKDPKDRLAAAILPQTLNPALWVAVLCLYMLILPRTSIIAPFLGYLLGSYNYENEMAQPKKGRNHNGDDR